MSLFFEVSPQRFFIISLSFITYCINFPLGSNSLRELMYTCFPSIYIRSFTLGFMYEIFDKLSTPTSNLLVVENLVSII